MKQFLLKMIKRCSDNVWWLEKHICALKPTPLFQSIIALFHCYAFAAKKNPIIRRIQVIKSSHTVHMLNCSDTTVKLEPNFGFGHRLQRFALMEQARWDIFVMSSC